MGKENHRHLNGEWNGVKRVFCFLLRVSARMRNSYCKGPPFRLFSYLCILFFLPLMITYLLRIIFRYLW